MKDILTSGVLNNHEALQRATKAVKAKFNQGLKRNQLGKWEQSIVNIEHIIMLIYVCVCVCVCVCRAQEIDIGLSYKFGNHELISNS